MPTFEVFSMSCTAIQGMTSKVLTTLSLGEKAYRTIDAVERCHTSNFGHTPIIPGLLRKVGLLANPVVSFC